jgi:hypothetical protein
MADEITISYEANPPGQVGPRPRLLAPGTKFKLKCLDKGEFTAEFIGDSPLKNGAKTVKKDVETELGAKKGRFQFKCILKEDGKDPIVLDPRDAAIGGGGEIEVGP